MTPLQPLPDCIGVLAASGAIPLAVCDAAARQSVAVHVVALKGQADPAIERHPHDWVRLGQVGGMLRSLRRAQCRDLVIVGSLQRPNLWRIGFDAGFFRHLPTILSLTRGGDDTILKRVIRFFEGQGFTIRGAHEIAPELLAPDGSCGRYTPQADHMADVRRGAELLDALAPFDVGQSAVVSRGHVLAVEAAEGTDAMLRRCAEIRPWGRGKRSGVMVKWPKAGQELRIDMPVIGPRTAELAAKAGLAGIAVASGQVMIAEADEMIAIADRHGLFVAGVGPADGAPAAMELEADNPMAEPGL